MWNEVVSVVLKVGDPKKECKNNISQNYIPRLATYFCPSGYSYIIQGYLVYSSKAVVIVMSRIYE